MDALTFLLGLFPDMLGVGQQWPLSEEELLPEHNAHLLNELRKEN